MSEERITMTTLYKKVGKRWRIRQVCVIRVGNQRLIAGNVQQLRLFVRQ